MRETTEIIETIETTETEGRTDRSIGDPRGQRLKREESLKGHRFVNK